MAEPAYAGSDIRPAVARARTSNLGLWAFMALVLVGGIWLFSIMSANRAEMTAPRTTMTEPDPGVRISSPPPLALPQDYLAPQAEPRRAPARVLVSPLPAPVRSAPPVSRTALIPPPGPPPIDEYPPPPGRPVLPQPTVVFDSAVDSPAGGASAQADNGRVTASRFANPSRTVPQGTVIPAVLETALDSTRPGGVRALVQRDIYGFDGTRVLVHRGSRLYGEYEADLLPGQKRALIRWTRLIRPDGVTIALDSPASDPLGRAGVKGKVDSKFFQRFGGAILQSVLDIGVGIATSRATDGVVVALPGSTQNIEVQDGSRVQPTLKVRHGTSVSVFVARDLDFSTVDF